MLITFSTSPDPSSAPRRIGLRWLLGLVILCGVSSLTQADELPPAKVKPIDEKVAAFMITRGVPGMSVAVARQGELQWAKGYGLADVENEVKVTPATRFRTASIAKPLTAALILSLVEDGRLDLDVPVQTYCPEFSPQQWTPTSRQLLGHLGGVRHYRSAAEAASTKHYFSLDEALETFREDPLMHEPGTQFRYTTFGYNLLGSIAEKAGKLDFMSLLKERVFRPASMESTVQDDVFAIVPNRTRGYWRPTEATLRRLAGGRSLSAGTLYNAPLHDTSMKIPGGGLLSTPSDLIRFATSLNQGKLVPTSSRDAMWTRQKTTDGTETSYGLGWSVGKRDGRQQVWHTGGQAGTSTILILQPEDGVAVAIMCNLQQAGLNNLAEEIVKILRK